MFVSKLKALLIKRLIPDVLYRKYSTFLKQIEMARFLRRFAPILVYHAVEPEQSNPLISGKFHNVSSDIFYQQLSLLKKYFRVVSLEEFTLRIKKGQNVEGLAVVTFDDGYLSVIKFAIPILKTLNIPATFFISTKLIQDSTFWRDKIRYIINHDLITQFLSFATARNKAFQRIIADPERFYRDTKDPAIINSRLVENMLDEFLTENLRDISWISQDVYCTPKTLRQVIEEPFTFGNHSHAHYVLSSMTKQEQYEDIVTAENILRELELPISKIFSIPFGGARDFTNDTLDILQELGYTGYVLSVGSHVVHAPLSSQQPNDFQQLIALQRFMPINQQQFLWIN